MTLKDSAILPPPVNGAYNQTDDTQDILGNLGFGLGYSPYISGRTRVLLQLEGEGFFGHRFQDTHENLPTQDPPVSAPSASIDNDLYGGIGRATVRFQYALGAARLLKAFADVGIETKYTIITYSGHGSPDELLWGPYVRVGLRYSF